VEAWFLRLAGQGSDIAPHPSVQLLNCNKHLSMFKIFVAVDKHQGFKSSTVKRHLSGLNVRPATLIIRLLIISKLLTISSNCGLWSPTSQHSTVQLLIWNEMNSDADIATVIATNLSIGPNVNVNKTSLVSLRFFLPVSGGSRMTG